MGYLLAPLVGLGAPEGVVGVEVPENEALGVRFDRGKEVLEEGRGVVRVGVDPCNPAYSYQDLNVVIPYAEFHVGAQPFVAVG